MATAVSDTNGCYMVPAFVGLGAPYWNQYARGCIVGLTRGVNANHIVRATLEAIAYQVKDVIEVMKQTGKDLDIGYRETAEKGLAKFFEEKKEKSEK